VGSEFSGPGDVSGEGSRKTFQSFKGSMSMDGRPPEAGTTRASVQIRVAILFALPAMALFFFAGSLVGNRRRADSGSDDHRTLTRATAPASGDGPPSEGQDLPSARNRELEARIEALQTELLQVRKALATSEEFRDSEGRNREISEDPRFQRWLRLVELTEAQQTALSQVLKQWSGEDRERLPGREKWMAREVVLRSILRKDQIDQITAGLVWVVDGQWANIKGYLPAFLGGLPGMTRERVARMESLLESPIPVPEGALLAEPHWLLWTDLIAAAKERLSSSLLADEQIALDSTYRPSPPSREESAMTIRNDSEEPIDVYWIDFGSRFHHYKTIPTGSDYQQMTFEGHRWEARQGGRVVSQFTATSGKSTWQVR
jgi:hypothetical protein